MTAINYYIWVVVLSHSKSKLIHEIPGISNSKQPVLSRASETKKSSTHLGPGIINQSLPKNRNKSRHPVEPQGEGGGAVE